MTSTPWAFQAPDGALLPVTALPTVSVVIPAFQAATTVVAAVCSALRQTRAPVEVVVCDDGSTDGTTAAVQGIDARVRVLQQPNRGEAAAKNAAVRAARGEVVLVLDADDVIGPRLVEAASWLLAARPDLDVVTTDAWLEHQGRRLRRAYHDGWPFPVDDQRAVVLRRNFVLGLAAVRRDRWLAAGGFDDNVVRTADWDFFARLVLGGSRVGLLTDAHALYRVTPGSLSSDRLDLTRSKLSTLDRLSSRPDLLPHEQDGVEQERAALVRDLRRRETREAVRSGAPDARRQSKQLLLEPGASGRQRLAALGWAVAPTLARTAMGRARRTESVGGLRVPIRQRSRPVPEPPRPSWSSPTGPVEVVQVLARPGSTEPAAWDDGHAALAGPVPAVLREAAGQRRTALAARDGRDVLPDLPVPAAASELRAAVRAQASVALQLVREEPALLPWTVLSRWTSRRFSQRVLRRVLLLPGAGPVVSAAAGRASSAGLDALLWREVRVQASREEWLALRSSYVCLAYHRIAGQFLPGQERYDVSPSTFARQLRTLRLAGLRPLRPEQLVGSSISPVVGRRGFVVTLDDGYVDELVAAEQHAAVRPQVYLPTRLIEGTASWQWAPFGDWEAVRRAAARGVVLGAHGRGHRPLPDLSDSELVDEVAGALGELRREVPGAPALFAYPNGRHDARVRAAACDAGYALAWTTLSGRNGVGTDPWCLRRVGVKDWDGPAEILWKALTGEGLPPLWERSAVRRWRRRQGGGRGGDRPPAESAGAATSLPRASASLGRPEI